MNKIVKSIFIAGIAASIVTPVFAQTTMNDVQKIYQSKSNVTVKPLNAYINWKGSRDDLRSNQIIVEFEINNKTLSDGIVGKYLSDVEKQGQITDVLEVVGTTYSKNLMVIQEGVELKPTFSSCVLIDKGQSGRMYLVLWTNNQNSTVDVVLGDEIVSLLPANISDEISKLLKIEENKYTYKK